MTASTVTQKYVGAELSRKKLYNFVRKQRLPNSAPGARLIPFTFTSDSVATTSTDEADDVVNFFTFPVGARLWSLLVTVPTALESGTPASVIDVRAGSTVLINDSQFARTDNGVDELDAGLSGLSVSNTVLNMIIVTPGDTEVAGTVQFRGLMSVDSPLALGA